VLGTKLQNPSSGFGSGLPILKIAGYAMTEFEKLKLPPSFEIVTVAEFLAALQPARDIARIGSKIVAILDGPTGTSRNIYFRFAHGCGRDQRSQRKTLGVRVVVREIRPLVVREPRGSLPVSVRNKRPRDGPRWCMDGAKCRLLEASRKQAIQPDGSHFDQSHDAGR
jgi:hypothetical protein